jgi:hypothetical protein
MKQNHRYLLHLYNMTNPPVARKTPDHANSPNGAVIFSEKKEI